MVFGEEICFAEQVAHHAEEEDLCSDPLVAVLPCHNRSPFAAVVAVHVLIDAADLPYDRDHLVHLK